MYRRGGVIRHGACVVLDVHPCHIWWCQLGRQFCSGIWQLKASADLAGAKGRGDDTHVQSKPQRVLSTRGGHEHIGSDIIQAACWKSVAGRLCVRAFGRAQLFIQSRSRLASRVSSFNPGDDFRDAGAQTHASNAQPKQSWHIVREIRVATSASTSETSAHATCSRRRGCRCSFVRTSINRHSSRWSCGPSRSHTSCCNACESASSIKPEIRAAAASRADKSVSWQCIIARWCGESWRWDGVARIFASNGCSSRPTIAARKAR